VSGTELDRLDEAAAAIAARCGAPPDVAIVLGSGLGDFADGLANAVTMPYDTLPHWPQSRVVGHAGKLVVGSVAGKRVAALSGRVHVYEGHPMATVVFAVRVMARLGVPRLILTNAAGGINTDFGQGALMIMDDHINLMGSNPLIGPNDDRLGPRFPDMSEPYDQNLRALARAVALEQGTTLREGIYVAVPGPNLETRAEYRMLRAIGADVVGMSTVPEVIVAVHQGMRVLGISIITDQCLPDALAPADIGRIIATAGEAEPRLTRLLATVVERLA